MNVAFVTGATGLVGTFLLYDLLQKGYRVKALKRSQSNVKQIMKTFGFYSTDAETIFQKIEWIDGDLLDFQSMSDAIDGCTQVYHAAAIVSFNRKDRAEMMHINVGGTTNIVNVCLEKKIALCFVSSIAALGNPSPRGCITSPQITQINAETRIYTADYQKNNLCKFAKICGQNTYETVPCL